LLLGGGGLDRCGSERRFWELGAVGRVIAWDEEPWSEGSPLFEEDALRLDSSRDRLRFRAAAAAAVGEV
jgi:hypothetical protein